MKTKRVVGQKIIAVKQSRVKVGGGMTTVVDELVLENGRRLRTHAYETETEPVGDLLIVKGKHPNAEVSDPRRA